MKAVLLSIQPKYSELIAQGKKTIEVRKTAPKLQTPFKCYIYCTKGKEHIITVFHKGEKVFCDDANSPVFDKTIIVKNPPFLYNPLWRQKVIGEFMCDKVDAYEYSTIDGVDIDDDTLLETMLDREAINIYAKGRTLYGLHIADLKIYDKPKELGGFFTKGECQREFCAGCKNFHRGEGWLDGSYCDEDSCIEWGLRPLTRPPQSWCYVEEL